MERTASRLFFVAVLASALTFTAAPVAHATDAAWHPLDQDASPAAGYDGAVAFDATRNLLYVSNYLAPDRIWAFSPGSAQTWSTLFGAGTPPPPFVGSMIHDVANDRLVLLLLGSPSPEIYTLNLSGPPVWHSFFPPDGPSQRIHQAAVYDPVGQRVIVYGGSNNNVALGDTWALTLGDEEMKWVPLYGFGPAGLRELTQAIYDPVGHRMIVHGGVDRTDATTSDPRRDVWAFSLEGAPEWTQLADAGGPERFGAASAYDPKNHRMLIFGGTPLQPAHGPQIFEDDSWAFDLATNTWTSLDVGTAPGNRSYSQGAMDDAGRFIIYGGKTYYGDANDLWSLDDSSGASWDLLHADPPRIDGRKDAALAYDQVRRRAILTGGIDANGVDNQTWVLGPGDLRFSKLTATNAGIALRSGGAGVWDPVRDRMLVFGGYNGAPSADVVALGGASSAWSVVSTALSPLPATRQYAGGAYDALRDRALFFAGSPVVNARNQVWALSLSATPPTWSLLAPGGTLPTQRWGHTFTADEQHDRMIMFGGGDGVGVVTNALYVLSLAGAGTWTKLTGPGTPPPARTFHSAIYDPMNDRLIIWGGKGQFGTWLNDTWEYGFGGSGWRQLTPDVSPPGARAAAVYEPGVHRMLIFGGETAVGLAHETWTMDLVGQTTGVGPGGPLVTAGFALEGAVPNPAASRSLRVAFALPDGSAARLELIDLAGRRVRSVDVGSLGAGRHILDLGRGGAIAPGLYFARLTRGGEWRTAKVCVGR